ncbi:redox-regulated ATPase YchF [Methanomassiliicoccus luminyensis]|uniref:redox-regulated ATPase YchF n=1 Tax=Methanomassiliicoccus luminyensis TaxID=1080712 RepID=UPI00036AEE23|nr:redox-regulated ATPase YchF [Methanomassiliicoccus luminyensis]
MQIGIVGKPNVGKSTFFSAATMASAEIAAYPFTTIKANKGVAFVRGKCPHVDFDTQCVPRNAGCENGTRLVPVELLDVAGLVPDAWQGRGLGNQFLDDLRQASVLIHVVDASGATDLEGNSVPPGSHDPVEDVKFLEREIAFWIRGILDKGWEKAARQAHLTNQSMEPVIHDRLTGLGVTEAQISAALRDVHPPENPMNWDPEVMLNISHAIRKYSKPLIIAMNKADAADDATLKRLAEAADGMAVPTCAETELALKKAAKAKLVSYLPGDDSFKIADPSKLNAGQKNALGMMEAHVKRFRGTGVQQCLEKAAFDLLDLIIVYPVEDEAKLTDHDGRVLPDAFLVPKGTTAKELAYKVHTDLGENFIRAINVRTHRTVGNDYVLQSDDVITIVSRK